MPLPLNLTLRTAPWLAAPYLQRLLGILNADGAVTRLVGGCVRNALLGRAVTDIDLATTLPPAMVMDRLTAAGVRSLPTGIQHGTLTALCGDTPCGDAACDNTRIEITTLRIDVRTDGRRADVAFTDDWTADARRRDFTMNALYADADGTVFDPLGGGEDLMARRVRFIGDPAARIQEDALRILRFFRFVATIQPAALPLDGDALAACAALCPRLDHLSGERIQSEMRQLLSVPAPLVPLRAMASGGITGRIGLPDTLSVVTEQRLMALAALAPVLDPASMPLRQLVILTDSDPARLAALGDRWRLSRQDQQYLLLLADSHQQALDTPQARWRLLDRVPFAVFADAMALFLARHPAPPDLPQLTALLATARVDKAKVFPVSGRDFLASGLPPGPLIGQYLQQARDLWVASGFLLHKKDILDKVKNKY